MTVAECVREPNPMHGSTISLRLSQVPTPVVASAWKDQGTPEVTTKKLPARRSISGDKSSKTIYSKPNQQSLGRNRWRHGDSDMEVLFRPTHHAEL